MSILFSEVELTAIMPDESTATSLYMATGHPDKERIRYGREFALLCGSNPQAIAVTAGVTAYVFGFTAEERDADEEHLKMIELYDKDCGSKFVNLTNVHTVGHTDYYFLPPSKEATP